MLPVLQWNWIVTVFALAVYDGVTVTYVLWSWFVERPFLQCFDTVGWVIWPVKPVPDITYNVFSGTLNPTQSINVERHREVTERCCRWSWWRTRSWTSFILEFSTRSWSWKSRRIATSSGLLSVFRRDIALRSIATFLFFRIVYFCRAGSSLLFIANNVSILL